MGKSSNGPDWTDVATMMSALSSLHECAVGCLITAATQGHNGIVQIDLIASFNPLPGSAGLAEVRCTSQWPNNDGRDFAAWVYGGLYHLDFKIGEAYQQRFVPTTE
jgi:hypothetical protein